MKAIFNAQFLRDLQQDTFNKRLVELENKLIEIAITSTVNYTFFGIETNISIKFKHKIEELGFIVSMEPSNNIYTQLKISW